MRITEFSFKFSKPILLSRVTIMRNFFLSLFRIRQLGPEIFITFFLYCSSLACPSTFSLPSSKNQRGWLGGKGKRFLSSLYQRHSFFIISLSLVSFLKTKRLLRTKRHDKVFLYKKYFLTFQRRFPF
jgi:hypothetical protein